MQRSGLRTGIIFDTAAQHAPQVESTYILKYGPTMAHIPMIIEEGVGEDEEEDGDTMGDQTAAAGLPTGDPPPVGQEPDTEDSSLREWFPGRGAFFDGDTYDRLDHGDLQDIATVPVAHPGDPPPGCATPGDPKQKSISRNSLES